MDIVLIALPQSRFESADGADRLGGIEGACIGLTRALAARGHRVTLVATKPGDLRIPGVAVRDRAPAGDLGGDAIVSCNDATALGGPAPIQAIWMHNPLTVMRAVRKGQLRPIVRLRPHAVFGSLYAKRLASPLLPYASRHVLPLGVDGVFADGEEPGTGHRNAFVWVSQPQRGLRTAIAAWRAALPRLPAATEFHVYSCTAARAGLSESEAAGLRLRFLPRAGKDRLAEAYRSAVALVCLGAHDETFCLAAAEAIAAGLPVLTLGLGCLEERVVHGVTGFVAGDADDLAARIALLARDAELAAQMRSACRAHRADYSWAKSAKLWEGLLLDLRARAGHEESA